MASVGSISWKTEKDEFLKESEVSDVVSSLDEGGLNELEGEFSSKNLLREIHPEGRYKIHP